MEEMFEEDLAHAREVRLLWAGRYLIVRQDHQIEKVDRGVRAVPLAAVQRRHPPSPGWIARPSRRVALPSTPTNTPSPRRQAVPCLDLPCSPFASHVS